MGGNKGTSRYMGTPTWGHGETRGHFHGDVWGHMGEIRGHFQGDVWGHMGNKGTSPWGHFTGDVWGHQREAIA